MTIEMLDSLPEIPLSSSTTSPHTNTRHTTRRPAPNVLTNPIEEDSSSSSASTSTIDSIGTLRPSSRQSSVQLDLETTDIPDETTLQSHSGTSRHIWRDYFSEEHFVTVSNENQECVYHAYLTPPSDTQKGPLFICLHGAGASGMSFARFSQAITALAPGSGILSLEAREHGSFVRDRSTQLQILDFGIHALADDALATIDGIRVQKGWTQLPMSVLVGHSLGGAVATRIAADGSLGSRLVGLQVLDVVEGSALEALAHMRIYLASRPPSFASLEAGIEWHVRSRTIRDVESARASVPSLLTSINGRWTWKTDLTRTEQWWQEWFTGMSKLFLQGRAAKALILAGADRLDKELMVGQMQGKFQLTVLPEAGHFIQEDVPERMASLAIEFFRRNDRSAMVLPPKVSDLIAQGKKV